MLDSLIGHPDERLIDEVVIVDNGNAMEDEDLDSLQDREPTFRTKIVSNEKTSYASGVNIGANEATGDLLIISNNDIVWREEWTIKPLLTLAQQDNGIGVVGPQLINQDGSWQRSSGEFPSLKSAIRSVLFINSIQKRIAARREEFNTQHRENVDYIDGAFLVTPAKLFDQLDGWDDQFEFYGEDADYCFRVQKAGKSVVLEPEARITHLEGATSSTEEPKQYSKQLAESTTQFVKIHRGRVRSRLYAILMAIANIERYFLYTVTGVLKESENSPKSRQRAVARFRGYIKRCV
jgi:GT2 family glycosyltransferase